MLIFWCLFWGINGVQLGAPEPELDLLAPQGEAINMDLEELASFSSLGVPIEAEDLARQMFAGDLLPEPFALFPLVGEDVNSIDGIYQGYPNTVQWIQDDRFGIVPYCDQNNVDHVITLESVPYYLGGELAINFWFKAHNVSGEHFQYLFSHSSIQFQQAQHMQVERRQLTKLSYVGILGQLVIVRSFKYTYVIGFKILLHNRVLFGIRALLQVFLSAGSVGILL
eukprot:TRINITY_DN2112_c0_g1_i5.p1 TRINITY_DN2112_c0_g1~~TRINITY_DN2112_c0_g1_i5.p1  ORF type:complete len:225 (+),score=19.70 TRINITY_DN2112_c0_g1_i5:146-820(+)